MKEPTPVSMYESPSSHRARWTLWMAIIGLSIFTAWASVVRVDQVTRAPAVIIASGRTQQIQSSDAGILTELFVKEGDKVKAGQALATLEKARAQAAVDDSLAKVAALKITVARLQAEVYNKPLRFSPDLLKFPEYIQNQTELYTKRKTAIDEDVKSLQRMLVLAQQELKMNEPLLAQGDVSQADVIRLRRQVADIQAQIANKKNKYFQDAQADMTKAQEDLSTQTEQLRDRSQVLEHTSLVSPTDGLVKNIHVTTIGGVVRASDVIMEIFPTNSDLIVEARVKPADIAFIKEGQTASVKLDAYDYSIFGAMRGVVTYMSPDTITEDSKNGPVSYYRVHIKINNAEFKGKSGEQITVRPGMTASVEIKALDRTVLSYLTKPITKTLSSSLGER